MSRLKMVPILGAVAVVCVMAGCQRPNRVIDPLPDPPMGALLIPAAEPSPPSLHTVIVSGPLRPVRSVQPLDPHRRPSRPATGHRIVLDPGHGGKDPGTISVIGTKEKHINLTVAVEAARLLKQRGITVWLTRASDVYLTLEQRTAIANQRRAHLFVSIHADSAANRSARGFTLYIARRASSKSYAAAKAIEGAMTYTGLTDRKVKRADFRVLIQTRGPAVLVELGFLSNRPEAALLGRPHFQKRLAEAVARGICASLGVRW